MPLITSPTDKLIQLVCENSKNPQEKEAMDQPFRQSSTQPLYQTSASALLKPVPPLQHDLHRLPPHPAIVIFDAKSIGIQIELCKLPQDAHQDLNLNPISKPDPNHDPITNMGALLRTLPHYSPHVTSIDLNIHAPLPGREGLIAQKLRARTFKQLFMEINNFKLTSLHLYMLLDGENFPQMKLAAGILGLEFKDWRLYYEVVGGSRDPVVVKRGSEFDSRLRGVFKREVLPA